ncbi:GTPase domain-containing protein [Cognataquiflexum aquatile]|uniref:GTPase domain-containing protein n=1 Tax=Cognataquiflexum aquatile TaxID=2249427 RepID=UPI0013003654|nr:hypothetical protein [Cognataquiflexum aquatile]
MGKYDWFLYGFFGIIIGLFSRKGYGFWKKEDGDKVFKKKLGVLGPSGSGKTHFLRYLKDGSISTKYVPTPLMKEEIKSIELIKNGKTLILERTEDLPGDDISIELYYGEFIKSCSHIFFLFNCNDFIRESNYRNHTIGMIKFVLKRNKPIVFLGTHIDVFQGINGNESERKNAQGKIIKYLSDKIPVDKFKHFEVINMKQINELEIIKENLFK